MKKIIVLLGFMFLLVLGASPDVEAAQVVSPPPPVPPPDVNTVKKPRGSIVIAPLPIVSPAIGSGLIPVGGYIFQLQEKDTKSAPSLVGAAGLITDNGSRGIALLADLYMKENRYELRAVYVNGAAVDRAALAARLH